MGAVGRFFSSIPNKSPQDGGFDSLIGIIDRSKELVQLHTDFTCINSDVVSALERAVTRDVRVEIVHRPYGNIEDWHYLDQIKKLLLIDGVESYPQPERMTDHFTVVDEVSIMIERGHQVGDSPKSFQFSYHTSYLGERMYQEFEALKY